MTDATILLYPGPRVHPVPITDAPGIGTARRRPRVQLAVRWILAFLVGVATGIVLPAILLILTGHAFLAALGI